MNLSVAHATSTDVLISKCSAGGTSEAQSSGCIYNLAHSQGNRFRVEASFLNGETGGKYPEGKSPEEVFGKMKSDCQKMGVLLFSNFDVRAIPGPNAAADGGPLHICNRIVAKAAGDAAEAYEEKLKQPNAKTQFYSCAMTEKVTQDMELRGNEAVINGESGDTPGSFFKYSSTDSSGAKYAPVSSPNLPSVFSGLVVNNLLDRSNRPNGAAAGTVMATRKGTEPAYSPSKCKLVATSPASSAPTNAQASGAVADPTARRIGDDLPAGDAPSKADPTATDSQ